MKLSRNFTSQEFTCPESGRSEMNPDFIFRLQVARDIAGIPFVINSGFRSQKYNDSLPGSVKDSAHTTGQAADIRTPDSKTRWKIIHACIAAGFRRIGIGKTFIHIDSDATKPDEVIWLY